MFHLLGFILIIFIVILVIGLSIVGSILRAIFGFGRRRSNPNNTHRTYRNVHQTEEGFQQQNKDEELFHVTSYKNKRHKFFSDSDGEYVDFEEIIE